ncbi:MAG: hypothetical protein C6H99_03270 [Epsilonproteobacteria bacterium]|nr:hypothetical protein [Campylobacterota bacterium]NPA63482.1 hypothetical protein [Campylobacterota bacterium]
MAHEKKLLEGFEEYDESRELTIIDLLIVVVAVLVALTLFVPKIYIANQIYYKSRNINKLLDDYEILKEENRLLNQKLEKLRFKTQVLDTIF